MRALFLLPLFALGCDGAPTKPDDTDLPVEGEGGDEDGDGFTADEGDCDDGDANVFPGAAEVCDGVDQDCDGDVDDGVTTTSYDDADGDGHGDPATAAEGCEPAPLPGDDCDDAAPLVFPGADEVCNGLDDDCDGAADEGVLVTWYADADGDGQGDAAAPVEACEAPPNAVANADDCDDTDETAFSGNVETCDEVDNDCDGAVDEEVTTTWWVDTDGDGFGDESLTQEACTLPTGYADNADDCDDLTAFVSPAASETCNGVDDDCDGATDEDDAVDAPTWYADADTDGWGDPATGAPACEAPDGAVAVAEDCDDADASLHPETLWHIDYDGDTYGNPGYTLAQCEAPDGYVRDDGDCDDTDGAVSPAGAEVCNGYDDDCDGLVDDDDAPVGDTSTWHDDADGDGFGDPDATVEACEAPDGTVADATDCDDTDPDVSPDGDEAWYDGVDSDCDGAEDPDVCDEVPGGALVAWDADCAVSYGGSWSVATEWTTDSSGYFDTASSYDQIMTTPVVGNLTDDDGDGDIDADDIPDVAFTTFSGSGYSSAGYLRVVSGDGAGDTLSVTSVVWGGTTWRVAGSGGVAIGDLEGDGSPDIVVMGYGGDVIALENDGTPKWVYDASFSYNSAPAIADMDGDGAAEVIVASNVLDATGAHVGTCPDSSYGTFAADVDGDGAQELVVGHALCEMDGTLVWDSGRSAGTPGVGNFDADDAAEIVIVNASAGTIELLDDDGTLLWSVAHSGGGGGAPGIADYDGDGEMEIAVAGTSYVAIYEATGTRKWRHGTDDSSSKSTGTAAFDFDADGAAELVYADEHTFWIFDGATGTAVWTTSSHQSGTLREYPVVADVDADGHAEIVLASNDYSAAGWTGIHVLGETNGQWASAPRVWNQFAYGDTAIGEDLSLPTTSFPYWLDAPGSRGQVAWSAAADGAADLAPVLLGGCEDCVADEVDLYVSVENTGAVFAPAGVSVALYAVTGTTRTLVDEQVVAEPIDPGERAAPLRFVVPDDDIGADGVILVVDDAGDVRECDEENNEAAWDAWTCSP